MATDNLHTSVWWDLDDCPFPTDWDCRFVGKNIRLALQRMGYDGYTTVVACGREIIRYPVPVVQSLSWSLSLCPLLHGSGERIKSDMKQWASHHPAPANLMLIVNGIGSYSSTLDELRTQNYNIFLAFPGLDDGPLALTRLDTLSSDHIKTATFVWNLFSLVRGGPPLLSNGIEFEFDKTSEDNIAMLEEMERTSALTPRSDSNAKTSIWWDIEECPLPKIMEDDYISATKNIAAGLHIMDYLDGPFTIETVLKARDYNGGPITFFTKTSCISRPFLSEDTDSIKFVHDRYTKKKMIAAMKAWAEKNPAPANILLISGDRAYISTLVELRSKKYKILVAHPYIASPDLIATASCVWYWNSLAKGAQPYNWSDGSEPYHKKFYQEEEAIPKGFYQEEKAIPKGFYQEEKAIPNYVKVTSSAVKFYQEEEASPNYVQGTPSAVLASEGRFASSKKRRSVGSFGYPLVDIIEALECMHDLTDEEEILVAQHLCHKTELIDLFFLLPVEKRVVMARMIIDDKI